MPLAQTRILTSCVMALPCPICPAASVQVIHLMKPYKKSLKRLNAIRTKCTSSLRAMATMALCLPRRFYEVLGERLKKFNLELSAEKTHIIPHVEKRTARKPAKFVDTLQAMVQRKPPSPIARFVQAVQRPINGIFQPLWRAWHHPQPGILLLSGYPPNVEVCRSQRKSYNWDRFRQLLTQFGVVKPHIVSRPKGERKAFVLSRMIAFAEASISEKPGALRYAVSPVPHAGICAGAVG